MKVGLLGTKEGMTTIFDENGRAIPSTVLACGPCVVTQIRTSERDGYNAVQLGYGEGTKSKRTKPYLGQFAALKIEPRRWLREFRLSQPAGLKLGDELVVNQFDKGDRVDVTGTAKGKGFAGTVKRHSFRGGPKSHGQSDRLRAPGSIGGQGPQRVFKGMRMAGHMGTNRVTVHKVEVVKIYPEDNLLVLKGAVPGPKGSLVIVKPTVKTVKIQSQVPQPAASLSPKTGSAAKPAKPPSGKK